MIKKTKFQLLFLAILMLYTRNSIAMNNVSQERLEQLQLAIEEENILSLEQYLRAGADVNLKLQNGDTPLHKAVSMGNKKMAKLLIQFNANITEKNDLGFTPVQTAEDCGNPNLTKYLKKELTKKKREKKEKNKMIKKQNLLKKVISWLNCSNKTNISYIK